MDWSKFCDKRVFSSEKVKQHCIYCPQCENLSIQTYAPNTENLTDCLLDSLICLPLEAIFTSKATTHHKFWLHFTEVQADLQSLQGGHDMWTVSNITFHENCWYYHQKQGSLRPLSISMRINIRSVFADRYRKLWIQGYWFRA